MRLTAPDTPGAKTEKTGISTRPTLLTTLHSYPPSHHRQPVDLAAFALRLPCTQAHLASSLGAWRSRAEAFWLQRVHICPRSATAGGWGMGGAKGGFRKSHFHYSKRVVVVRIACVTVLGG